MSVLINNIKPEKPVQELNLEQLRHTSIKVDGEVSEPQPEEPSAQPLLRLHDVWMGWENRTVLQDINLTVNKGDFITIKGPNGGGKTTLLRIILGLLKPASGTVTRHTQGMRIGYLPQKNMLDAHFPITVREVIMSGLLAVPAMKKADRIAAYNRVIDMVALREHQDRPIGVLSGGQLQRALLARAIVSGPEMLVLDEPLSYIDNRFEARLYDIVSELSKHTTVVMVTHQMTALSKLTTRHFIVDRTLHECSARHHWYRTDCE